MTKIYLKLGKFAGKVLSFWTKHFGGKNPAMRTRVLIINNDGKILLVRNVVSTTGKWTLPGGGVKLSEDALRAAMRELHEELGVRIPEENLEYLADLPRSETHLRYPVVLFKASVTADFEVAKVNKFEIADITWADRDDLPKHTANIVKRAVQFTHS